MKKFSLFVIIALCSVNSYAQSEEKSALEIHMNGSKREVMKKLEAAGFVETKKAGQKCYVGMFAGETVDIYITGKRKAYQTMSTDAVKVIQVLPDGSALACTRKPNEYSDLFLGPVVRLAATPGISYYDDLVISTGGVLKIVDTYTYETRNEREKTVPVVIIENNNTYR